MLAQVYENGDRVDGLHILFTIYRFHHIFYLATVTESLLQLRSRAISGVHNLDWDAIIVDYDDRRFWRSAMKDCVIKVVPLLNSPVHDPYVYENDTETYANAT